MNKLEIDKVRDPTDSWIIEHETLYPLPLSILIIGPSLISGKTNLLMNLILKKDGYKEYFKPENIYIISESLQTYKYKTITEQLDIPEDNLFPEYDENQMKDLYDLIKEIFKEEEDDKKEHTLIIMDDVAYDGQLSSSSKKVNNIIDKIACNGRHQLISYIIIAQKYTQLSTTLRNQAKVIIMFGTDSNHEIETFEKDNNSIMTKKEFINQFHKSTEEPNSFIVINKWKKGTNKYTSGLYEPFI